MAARWSSLVVTSEVYSLDMVCGLLTVVVSCCRAWALGCVGFSTCSTWAQYSWYSGSRARAQKLWLTGLVAPRACGISQDQGWNLCLLHYQADS